MTKKNKYYKRIYFLGGIFIILLTLLFWLWTRQNSSYVDSITSQETNSYKFYSKNLKFEIEVPVEYKIVDTLSSVTLGKGTQIIVIGRNGTNFEDIHNYLVDLGNKNKTEYKQVDVIDKSDLKIVKTIPKNDIIDNGAKVTYFIYTNYTVYSISTSSPELYEDLDKIAKSFHYVP